MLNLKELDLSKADWKRMYHPDIDLNKVYLCFVGHVWVSGYFQKAWFGYTFRPNRGSHSLQFDNATYWHIVYEMEDTFAQVAFPRPVTPTRDDCDEEEESEWDDYDESYDEDEIEDLTSGDDEED